MARSRHSTLLQTLLLVVWVGECQAQTAELVALGGDLSGRVLLYRDVDAPHTYYVMPLALSIEKNDEGKEKLGIQLYKSDSNKWKASVTLSVKATVSTDDTDAIKKSISDPAAVFAPVPTEFRAGYLILDEENPRAKPNILQTSSGPAGSTVAETFELSADAADLKSLLSASSKQQLGLFITYQPNISVAVKRTIVLTTAPLASKFLSMKFLSASSFGTGELFDTIRKQLPTKGSAEEVAAYAWLSDLLGAPTLSLSAGQTWLFGWDLTDDRIQKKLKAQDSVTIPVLSKISTLPPSMAILPMGNICQKFQKALVNLEDGTVGCAGLN